MAEKFANPPLPSQSAPWVVAHLSAAITTTPAPRTTESYAVDASAPPALQDGEFRGVLEDEYVLITPGAAGASPWTFVRGAEDGSIISTHPIGTPIYHVPTAGAWNAALGQARASAIAIGLALG